MGNNNGFANLTFSFSLRSFLLHTFWCKSSIIYDQIRGTNGAWPLGHDKKALAREVNPLALGYRTALSPCPA